MSFTDGLELFISERSEYDLFGNVVKHSRKEKAELRSEYLERLQIKMF